MELTATTPVVAEPTSASPATAAAVDPTMPAVIALPVAALPALPEIVLSPWALLGAVSGLLLAVGVAAGRRPASAASAAADADPGMRPTERGSRDASGAGGGRSPVPRGCRG